MVKKIIKRSALSPSSGSRLGNLYLKISSHIESAKKSIQRTVDTEMVKAYWLIGREIFKEEQHGKARAEYGSYLLNELSKRLSRNFGKGFSLSTLKDMRQFYLAYSDKQISHAVRGQSKLKTFSQNLGWIHYRALMRIDRLDARKFYEIEAEKNHWSGRELERQIDSLLYDRLAKSKDKKGLLKLACKGQEINQPEDAIKEPLILEFLGIPESHKLVESKLEESLINNLQQFLLELGKGFAFVGRQKRLTLDGEHFYADLVFYHVILKCYVVIDLKTKKLTHSDLGQMLLYVNYFDQEIKTDTDNPTIGLILCTKKSDAMVKYMLGDKTKQVFAKKYQFHLPTEEELAAELKREIKEIEHQVDEK
jgi:predicted nuclease of restriction endonuclease-like (RecB) superfamily